MLTLIMYTKPYATIVPLVEGLSIGYGVQSMLWSWGVTIRQFVLELVLATIERT